MGSSWFHSRITSTDNKEDVFHQQVHRDLNSETSDDIHIVVHDTDNGAAKRHSNMQDMNNSKNLFITQIQEKQYSTAKSQNKKMPTNRKRKCTIRKQELNMFAPNTM